MKARLPIIIIVAIAAAVLIWFLIGRGAKQHYLSGYIEGENLYLSAPVSGTVQSVSAVEGTRVRAGQPLFQIEPATLGAQSEQARAATSAARTQIASAQATADQAEAEVRAAQATADRARSDLARLLSVRRDDPAAVAGKEIDAARAALREAKARVAATRETAAARRAQVTATRAEQLSGSRYRGGLVTYSDVLQNQGRRLTIERQIIETKGALARDSVALFKALGGGWPEGEAVQ